MPASRQHRDRRREKRGLRLARSWKRARTGRAAKPVNRLHLAEETIDLGLGAAAARRCQPSALQLAIISAFQALAELLGTVAFLRPPDQGAQAWPAWRAVDFWY